MFFSLLFSIDIGRRKSIDLTKDDKIDVSNNVLWIGVIRMKGCAVIIPALNPSEMLLQYVKKLSNHSFSFIVVVNDGSDPSCQPIFSKLEEIVPCTVLTHQTNRGKGRALKTAFTYILENTPEDLIGVVTADADGQHAATDVCNIADMLMKNKDHLILGVRQWDEDHVPVKSILGNKLTSYVFYLLFKRRLIDTQTGLRGISKENLTWIIRLKGERYEFEMNMLINAIKRNIAIQEHKIETIYYNENAGSYYKTIVDSIRILRRIISGFLRKSSYSNQNQELKNEHDN